MPESSERYLKTRDLADDYQETVMTLLAFAAFVCHDGRTRRPGSEYGFGRRMTTSAANSVSPLIDVTPDCVAQLNRAYGLVAEVKKQLPRDQEHWEPHLKQLLKYDDRLIGWWAPDEKIEHSDATLLIHQSRGRLFVRYLEEARAKDPASVASSSSVIEFNRSDEGQPYIFFRREWGNVSHPDLKTRLDVGVPIPMGKVLISFPSIRFYDAEPPREDLMKTLWLDSFLSRWVPGQGDPETGVAEITVTVDELTDELQRGYGSKALPADSRSAEFPKASWIRDALDAFVKLGMAATDWDRETYQIKYKVFPKNVDVLEKLCQLTEEAEGRRDVASQIPLPFGAKEDTSAPKRE